VPAVQQIEGVDVMQFVAVKNFERFQHYKDRNPPWIKLHSALLDDYDFGRLQDASKMHLMGIWVLASKCDNRVPADPEWIAKRIGANTPVNLEVLINAGFLLRLQRASDSLDESKQSATQSRGETEAETETESTLPAAREAFAEVEKQLPEKGQRDAFRGLTRASRNPEGFALEVHAILTGMHRLAPYHPTAAQLGKALWDMSVNGKAPEVAILHSYAVRAAAPPRAGPKLADDDGLSEYQRAALKLQAEADRASKPA
jgi:hypothetical protein